MAKISIKSDKTTAFGGINFVMGIFDALLGDVIDRILGIRSTTIGYQYSEIIRSLFSVYFCGGTAWRTSTCSCAANCLTVRTPECQSSDTMLRAIETFLSVLIIRYLPNKSRFPYEFT